MTGFQEQKMKCICWEIATNDYEYRYKRYSNWGLGECSSYKDKNTIYVDLLEQIKKEEGSFVIGKNKKNEIIADAINCIKFIFGDSKIALLNEKNFSQFLKIHLNDKNICINNGKNDNKLFDNEFKKEYEKNLYKHRNRCAHNLFSYQQNLPDFKSLIEDKYVNNYYIWFLLLLIIDEIFIGLFKKYLSVIDFS